MDVSDKARDHSDSSSLRLVSGRTERSETLSAEPQFVNFMFFRVNPSWRKLDAESKSIFKRQFQAVYDSYHSSFLLFSYSLVGFDSKADIMFWRIGDSLDQVQEMTAKLFRTSLGSYLETAENYLAVTKRMAFVPDDGSAGSNDRELVIAGKGRYHFVYPCAKHTEWYDRSGSERDAMIEENFMVGKKFPNIRIHLTHAFGSSDQEYLISFETDEPRDFLALAEELRETSASKLTLRGMPVYTCRKRPLMECLDALG